MEAQVNGTTLYYELRGSGPPLMLMHGGLGFDHTCFLPTFDALTDQATVIYYDHRGNGRSERPSSLADVSHATWIADADALRTHLGFDRMVLFGHSYGALLAQEYALAYPEHLAGLILCCAAPVLDYSDVIQANAVARGTPEELAALDEVFGRPMADDADFRAVWNRLAPMYWHRFDSATSAAIDATTVYNADTWNHVNTNCLSTFNVTDALPSLRVPTLILSGADDWIMPAAQGKRLQSLIPNATFVEFSASGHWPFLEERERFLSVMRDWLAERDERL